MEVWKNKLSDKVSPRVNMIGNPISYAEVFTTAHIFRFENVLDAINMCFLIYNNIGIDFPEQSKDAWAILSEVVYNVKAKYSVSTEAATLIADLIAEKHKRQDV